MDPAGGSPTAVAVVSDVLSVRRAAADATPPGAPTAFHKVAGDFVAPHYVRFTVNEPHEWERLLAWGVDGITTDYPDRLIARLTR